MTFALSIRNEWIFVWEEWCVGFVTWLWEDLFAVLGGVDLINFLCSQKRSRKSIEVELLRGSHLRRLSIVTNFFLYLRVTFAEGTLTKKNRKFKSFLSYAHFSRPILILFLKQSLFNFYWFLFFHFSFFLFFLTIFTLVIEIFLFNIHIVCT